MSDRGLPASRTEALATIVMGIFSSLIGQTPAKGATYSIVYTALSNVVAIITSMLTLRDIYAVDSIKVETHLGQLMLGLVIQTIVASALSLLVLLPCINRGHDDRLWRSSADYEHADDGGDETDTDSSDTCFDIGVLCVIFALPGVLIFGLVELFLSYSRGCDEDIFKGAALCEHSSGYVWAAILVAGILGFLGYLLVIGVSMDRKPDGICSLLCRQDSGDETESNKDKRSYSSTSAALTRQSAFIKVCLLGVYWFLVDADMSWEFFEGHTVSWWVTGQWVKQGASIANIFLNRCGGS